MSDAAVLASITRGTAPEAVIRGHIAVVDGDGALLASLGDPLQLTTLRSAVKSFQAIPLARARRWLDLPEDELAIACASHSGSAEQVAVVRRLLHRAELDEDALSCGPQPPGDLAMAAALIRSGEAPAPIYNNCSGKHAGMLAACVAHDWPVEDYAAADHPLQREIAGHLGRLLGIDTKTTPAGIDGCGLPTLAAPLQALAVGFMRATLDTDTAACHRAMVAHPRLIAGRRRLDTVVLEHCGARLVCKGGGAAVWAAALRDGSRGLAIKLEAGDAAALPSVVGGVLGALGVLPEPLPAELDERLNGPLRNWAGLPVATIDHHLDELVGSIAGAA